MAKLTKKEIIAAYNKQGLRPFSYDGYGGYRAVGLKAETLARGFRDDVQAENYSIRHYKKFPEMVLTLAR